MAALLPLDKTPQKLEHTALGRVLRRIAFTPALLSTIGLIGLCAGCAGETDETPVLATVHSSSTPSIFSGVQDDDSRAIPGVVALRVGASGTFELCSGALLAPNVVLTARHCVTKNLSTSVACDENGKSANGPHVAGDQDPINIGVYTGDAPNFATRPLSFAKAIVAPTGAYLCDSDIALVVLEDPITDVAPLAVRLSTPAQAGETIRSVGYGQNDKKLPIGTRFRKSGVEVLAQGRMVSHSKTPLGAHEFEVGRSICQGDSGGPAISEETGAVIGVVSRGNECDQDFGHIYTTTAGFEELFSEAFTLANAEPTLETGNVSRTTPKSTSTDVGGAKSTPAAGGCSTAPRGNGNAPVAPALGVALAAALVLRSRRRTT
jgi:MYXO-CTERM domain-containing protein